MEKQYLADQIGEEEIALWRPGQNILITSPTGSGKSTFILKILLPFAAKKRKHVCYLCNRKILEEQITVTAPAKLREFFGDCDVSEDLLQFLHIITFQYCESGHGAPEVVLKKEKNIAADDIMFYVYDECHYFVSDALFNSGTNFWTSAIIRSDPGYTARLNVFLTATPEPFEFFFAAFYSKPKLNLDEQIQGIRKLYLEKGKRKKELMYEWGKLTADVSMNTGKVKLRRNRTITKREIAAQCREIDPYGTMVEKLQNAKASLEFECYPKIPIADNFNQFSPHYFHDYAEIFEQIQTTPSGEKWMIFVDEERDGIDLAARLNQSGIHAVLLSRATYSKTKKRKSVMREIADTGHFSCRVLLATELLDCGVSITDSTVKHIVISHSRKNTFLQMLGRRRTQAEDNVHLYLRCYSPKEINGRFRQYDAKMRMLVNFALLNKTYLIQKKPPSANDDGLREKPFLSTKEKEWTIRNICTGHNSELVYPLRLRTEHRTFLETKQFANDGGKLLEEYAYSKTAFIALLYELAEYGAAIEIYRSSKDSCFYLKQQLGWLGKSYDETRWLTYASSRKALTDYLMSSEGEWIPKDMQKEFSERCMELLLDLPVPPLCLLKDVSRFRNPEKNLYPGLKRLNESLKEVNVPYHLVSKQKCMPDRMTCWCVVGGPDHDARCSQ